MQTAIIGLLALLTYGNPLLLVLAWFLKLTLERAEGPRWRTSLLWIGLPLATIAVVAFWVGTQYGPTTPRNELVFRRLFQVSILMAAAALLAAIAGKGPERKWVAASALITPLSWFWALFMF